MRTVGLEPTHPGVLEPKSSASTNFARLARRERIIFAMHRARSRSLYLTRHGRPRLLLPLLLALACNLERGGGEPQAQQTTPAAPQKGPAAPPSGLAELREDAPLSLKKLLGQPVAAVDAILGAPKGAVLRRASCVRFVPERVFFACDSVTQTYSDPTAQFRQIQVGAPHPRRPPRRRRLVRRSLQPRGRPRRGRPQPARAADHLQPCP
jgi:hypothetical protein